MNYGVVNEPRENGVHGCNAPAASFNAQIAGDARPESMGRVQHLCCCYFPLVFFCEAFGFFRARHRADDCKAQLFRGKRPHCEVGGAASNSVREKQFISANGLDELRRICDEMVDSRGISPPPKRIRIGPEGYSLTATVKAGLTGLLEFMFAENQLAENQKAAGSAAGCDRPLHCGFLAGDRGVDDDCAAVMFIEPPAVAEAHFKAGRQCQKMPCPVDLSEHAKPARPADIVGIARYREQPMQ